MLSNRVYFRETTTEVSKISAHTDIDWGWSSKSPNGATLLHSPGRKPWVYCFHTFFELRRSGTLPTNTTTRTQSHEPQRHKANTLTVNAAPAELILLLSVCTQGCISGCALITPWALQECRAYGTHIK